MFICYKETDAIGIEKITKSDAPRTAEKETVVSTSNANTHALLERVFLFLEDGKWQDANLYCEKVLDIDPKNAEAYLGKLMAELGIRKREMFAEWKSPFYDSDNYKKILRFGDETLKMEMKGYNARINKRINERLERIERGRKHKLYNNAKKLMDEAKTEGMFKQAANAFAQISEFQNADSNSHSVRWDSYCGSCYSETETK